MMMSRLTPVFLRLRLHPARFEHRDQNHASIAAIFIPRRRFDRLFAIPAE
jgi:hypothetical protein